MPNIEVGRLKKEHILVLCIIFILLIVIVAYTNVFSPLLGKIRYKSEQIEQRKRSIQRARISPEDLNRLKQEIEEIKAKIDNYQKKLESSAEMPQILKELNDMAERLKIKFVSVNPQETEKTLLPAGTDEFLIQTPIRLKLQCGYHQLGIFINQIENSPRFMKITELKINAVQRDVWSHQSELVITSYSLVSKK